MADEESKRLLRLWNFENLIDHFERNKVTSTVLQEMTKDIMNELIPNVVERLAFMAARQKHFDLPKSYMDEPNITNENTSPDKYHQLERQNHFIGKKSFYVSAASIRAILELDSVAGASIVKNYKGQPLTVPERKVVTELVVRDAMKNCKRLRNEDFEALAKKIVALFPSEPVNIYYRPPIPKSAVSRSKPSQGRLPDKFRNFRQSQSQYKKLIKKPAEEVPRTPRKNDSELQQMKKWLFSNNSPWNRVLDYWKQTNDLRRVEMKDSKLTLVTNFVKECPILEHPDAYQLIHADFESMRLTDVKINAEDWFQFFDNLRELYPLNARDTTAQLLVDLLAISDLDEDSKISTQ